MTKFAKAHFSGAGHIHGSGVGSLQNMLAEVFGRTVKTAVGGETAYVDNSTGAADADRVILIAALRTPTKTGEATAGTTASPKTGFETMLGTLRDAIAIVAKEMIDAAALIGPAMDALTPETANDWGGGTMTAENTIAAITKLSTAVTTVSGNALNASLAAPVILNYEKAIATLVLVTNQLADATYYTPRMELPDAFMAKAILPISGTLLDAFLATSVGAASSVPGENFLDVSGENWVSDMADVIATIAAVYTVAVNNTLPVPVHAPSGLAR